MERPAAVQILQALAQGVDPHTGECLPASGPYQHPDTVRALFHALEALTTAPATRLRPGPQAAPSNAGKPWSEAEDAALAAAFDAGQTVAAIAERHGRTRAAIQARLVRLGKIEAPAELPRFSRLAASAAQAA